MGDRCVFGFKESKNAVPVFLYSHWGGGDRHVDLQRALSAAQPRWSDAAYATRIAISQIVENYWSEELGFGITAGDNSFCEPDYNVVPVVVWSEQKVRFVSSTDSTDEVEDPIDFSTFLALISC